MKGLRGDDNSCSRLRDGADAVNGWRDLTEPAVKLFGEGRPLVRVPGAGVTGFSFHH